MKNLMNGMLMMLMMMAACGEDEMLDDNDKDPIVEIEVTVEDFTASVNDGPAAGDLIGTIKASTTSGDLSFELTSESAEGALAVDASTGELTVADEGLFDYEVNASITAVVNVASGDVNKDANVTITVSGISTTGISVTIAESPTSSQYLGQITATTNTAELISYSFISQDPAEAMKIGEFDGEISVLTESLFDYETRQEVTGRVKVVSADVIVEVDVTITLTDVLPTWQVVGTAEFTVGKAQNQSFAMYDGIPYIAFRDEDNGNKTTVMKYENEEWQIVGTAGISDGYATYQSLAINDGVPYVAFRDDLNSRTTTVMKYDEGSWQVVGSKGFSANPSISPKASEYQSLKFDNGVPYVAYKDYGPSSNKATVMKFNGTKWVVVGDANFSAGGVDYTSLAFDNGVPYVAYKDDHYSAEATVMKFENDSWKVVHTVAFSAGAVDYTHIAFDAGVPYVAYSDQSVSGKATVMKLNNAGSWQVVGSTGFSQGDARFQTIAFDEGVPYVAFRDSQEGGKATLMKFEDGSWTNIGDAGFTAGNANNVELIMDNGIPYVAYRTDATKPTLMRYDDK